MIDVPCRWYCLSIKTLQEITQNWPSQFDANLSSVLSFRPSPFILHTKSLSKKAWGFVFKLYLRVVRLLHTSSWTFALSRSSCSRFNYVLMHYLLTVRSTSFLWVVCSPTSTDNVASVSYVRLYNVSSIEELGVHRYTHNTSSSSSAQHPLASHCLFFNSVKISLLAASTCPFI